MPKILFMYPNKFFLEFISNYLGRHSYEVATGTDGASLYSVSAKVNPELILIGRNLPSLELHQFLFKKKLSNTLKGVPVYLIGNFSTQEIFKLKEYSIEAYISSPINPSALLERLDTTFKRYNFLSSKRNTPMLADLNVKGKIFVIQIEANLEPDKIDILNYKIRSYCIQKQIKDPRLFYIIPSIYPETVNNDNLEILFELRKYPEFSVSERQIKILTKNSHFIETLKANAGFSNYEIVPDYIYGMERLNIDFDNMKTIPVNYLTAGCSYALDLYDENGSKRIPSKTPITNEIIEYFKSIDLRSLVYYSSKDISELEEDDSFIHKDDVSIADSILNQNDSMDSESIIEENTNDKMVLFYNKIRGMNCLIISDKRDQVSMIRKALEDVLKVTVIKTGENIEAVIDEKKYIMVILDLDCTNPSALEILSRIRTKASRRKMTVIIHAQHIDMPTLARFKRVGTDYVLVYPYNKTKLLHKVFEFLTGDREN